MDPTTIALGVLVALQTAYTSWVAYRGTRATASAENEVGMASLIDSRIRAEFDRQDKEIKELKDRIAQIERVEDEFRVAQIYMKANGLVWPAPYEAV